MRRLPKPPRLSLYRIPLGCHTVPGPRRKNTTSATGLSLSRSTRTNSIRSYSASASGIAAGTVSRYIAPYPRCSAHRMTSSNSRRPSPNPRNPFPTQSRFISQAPSSVPVAIGFKATHTAAWPSTIATRINSYAPRSSASSASYLIPNQADIRRSRRVRRQMRPILPHQPSRPLQRLRPNRLKNLDHNSRSLPRPKAEN